MLNMDFSQTVVIDTNQQDWVASPMAGVWRKPLAREEAERGHATSVVRYEAGARFSAHDHPKGEEILVLNGVFSDESGDYPAGTYFRNPEGFRHAPFSAEGCEILVKLHQFQADDSEHVCIDILSAQWLESGDGMSCLPLHQWHDERVELLRTDAAQTLSFDSATRGLEIFVIEGVIEFQGNACGAGCWLRLPSGAGEPFQVRPQSLIWVKQNHLTAQS